MRLLTYRKTKDGWNKYLGIRWPMSSAFWGLCFVIGGMIYFDSAVMQSPIKWFGVPFLAHGFFYLGSWKSFPTK